MGSQQPLNVFGFRPMAILPVDYYTIIRALSTNVPCAFLYSAFILIPSTDQQGFAAASCTDTSTPGKTLLLRHFLPQQVSAGTHFAMTTHKYTHTESENITS